MGWNPLTYTLQCLDDMKVANYKVRISEISIEGYNLFHSGFENDNSRGTVIYVDNCLKASEITLPISFQENLFVEIKGINNNDTIIIGNIYRSPNSTSGNNSKMCEIINHVCVILISVKNIHW